MQDKVNQSKTGGIRQSLLLVSGVVTIVVGLIGSSFGSVWSPKVYEFLFDFRAIESVDTFMPYFPLVPFYPIFIIMLGAYLIVRSRS